MKSAPYKEPKPTIRFTAKPVGSLLPLPEGASSKLPEGKVSVEGVINNFPFQTASIESDGKNGFALKLTKSLREAAGDEELITVEITRVGDETETRLPTDFKKALTANPKAKTTWEDTTPLARRDWIFWILTGRKAETRAIRITKGCSKLASGMRRVCCFAGIAWVM